MFLSGSTVWNTMEQMLVQTSTIGVETTALKLAVEEARTLQNLLILMDVEVKIKSMVYIDKISMVLEGMNLASSLNSKLVATAYCFVKKHIFNGVVKL